MLRTLEDEARSSKQVAQALRQGTRGTLLTAVAAHFQGSALFARALAGITHPDVEGCVCDSNTSAINKSQGVALIKKEQYWEALVQFTEALRFLGASSPHQQQEASRLHCNRVLALLKQVKQRKQQEKQQQDQLGRHPSKQQQQQQQQDQRGQQPSKQQPCEQHLIQQLSLTHPASPVECVLLEAAAVEATAAVQADPSSHKAYYRRASVRQLQGQFKQAAEDCCHALQLTADASASREIKQLQLEAQAQLQQQQQQQQQQGELQQVSQQQRHQHERLQLQLQQQQQEDSPPTKHKPQGPTQSQSHNQHKLAHANTDLVQAVSKGALCLKSFTGSTTSPERELVAARLVPAGTDVLTEQPAAFVLRKAQRAHRCGVCATELASGLPPDPSLTQLNLPVFCTNCPLALYCSMTCREKDVFHHPSSPECALPWPRVLPEEVLLATRLATWEQRLLLQQQTEQLQGLQHQGLQQKGDQQEARCTGQQVGHEQEGCEQAGRTEHSSRPGQQEQQQGRWATATDLMPFVHSLLGHEDKQTNGNLLSLSVLAVLAAAAHNAGLQRRSPQTQQQQSTALPAGSSCHQQLRPAVSINSQQRHQSAASKSCQHRHSASQNGLDRSCWPLDAASVLKWLCRVAVNGFALRPIAAASPTTRSQSASAESSHGQSSSKGAAGNSWEGGGPYGMAVFTVASCLNHSCQPNLTLRFDGCSLIARASQDLQHGSPALTSYGPQVGENPTEERQRHLRSFYHFECTCQACTPGNVHDATPESLRAALQCPVCPSKPSLPAPSSSTPGLPDPLEAVAGSRATKVSRGYGPEVSFPRPYLPPPMELLLLCSADSLFQHLASSSQAHQPSNASRSSIQHTLSSPASYGSSPQDGRLSPASHSRSSGAHGLSTSSTCSDGGSRGCSCCGVQLSARKLASYGRDLSRAAELAAEAGVLIESLEQEAALLRAREAAPQQAYAQAQQALSLSMKALEIYDRILHPANLLVGHTSHFAGRAAAMAAWSSPVDSSIVHAQQVRMGIKDQQAEPNAEQSGNRSTHSQRGLRGISDQQAASECYARPNVRAAHLKTAAAMFMRSHAVLAVQYPPRSPQLAFELYLAGACMEGASGAELHGANPCGGGGDVREARSFGEGNEVIQEAKDMLNLHFGQDGMVAACSYAQQECFLARVG